MAREPQVLQLTQEFIKQHIEFMDEQVWPLIEKLNPDAKKATKADAPAIAEFVAAYTAETGEVPNGFAALAYDAVGLLAAAMTAEGSADPDRIGPGLHAIGAYHGLTGTISYPTGTRIPRKSVTILEVAGGKQGLVDTLMPTQVPPP